LSLNEPRSENEKDGCSTPAHTLTRRYVTEGCGVHCSIFFSSKGMSRISRQARQAIWSTVTSVERREGQRSLLHINDPLSSEPVLLLIPLPFAQSLSPSDTSVPTIARGLSYTADHPWRSRQTIPTTSQRARLLRNHTQKRPLPSAPSLIDPMNSSPPVLSPQQR